MEDFRRDYAREHLKDLTPEERLEGLPVKVIEEYLKRRKEHPASQRQKKKKNRDR
jgi:hypothetical protein